MKLSVIGTGYLGAVHAACMAQIGHEVVAYDTDASKIATLSTGTSPFFEPGFECRDCRRRIIGDQLPARDMTYLSGGGGGAVG